MTHKQSIITVCRGRNCEPRGAAAVWRSVEESFNGEHELKQCECLAYCKKGPNVEVNGQVLSFCDKRNVHGKIQREIKKQSMNSAEDFPAQSDAIDASINKAIDELM